jgi:excisionase family DNA binding protein
MHISADTVKAYRTGHSSHYGVGPVEPATPPTARPLGSDFPPVLTAAMGAELLQVNVEYLRRMVRDGRVPCHRFPGGRELRFLRDELLTWLAALPGDDQSSSGRTHQIDAVGT